jgi:hypothetical protein
MVTLCSAACALSFTAACRLLGAAFTLSFILDTLVRNELVTDAVAARVKQFIAENQTDQQQTPADLAAAKAAAEPTPKRWVGGRGWLWGGVEAWVRAQGVGVGDGGGAAAGGRGNGARQAK